MALNSDSIFDDICKINYDNDDKNEIKSMLKQIRIIKTFPGVSERYYQYDIYTKNKDGHNYDQIVLQHSNRFV